MKLPQLILVCLLAFVLFIAVVTAEVAFRLERTLLSYGFTYREMGRLLEPLDNADTHSETIREAFRYIRRSLSLPVPRELEPYILEAAVDGFSARWVRQTAGNWLVTTQQVLHGRRDTLEYPLSLSRFKSSLLSLVRQNVKSSFLVEITRALDEVPASVDLAGELSDGVKRQLITLGRSMSFSQVILQYVIPGLLILACFYHGKIGTGFLTVGASFVVAGLLSLVVVYGRSAAVAAAATRYLEAALPDFLSWFAEPVGSTVEAVVRSGGLTAIFVTAAGALCATIGVILVVKKGDPKIRFGGE